MQANGKTYIYKSQSEYGSEDDMEAGHSEIEHEEYISAMVG